MKKLVVGNWKQNKNLSEVEEFFKEFATLYKSNDDVAVVICPSFPHLQLASWLIKKYTLTNVFVGSQNISEFEGGQHTGEVSVQQVKDLCEYSIIGHSETGDSPELVSKKVELCLSNGIKPVLCVKGIEDFKSDFDENIILVFEDPSTISKDGVFKVLSIEDISQKIAKIREKIGNDRPLLYGGSVNSENVDSLLSIKGISGFLPGSFSLKPQSFVLLINKLA